jgi:hypothetical protein
VVGISISEHVITFLLTSLYLKFSANIVHLGMPTPSFLGGRWHRQPIDQFDQRDKQCVLGYYRAVSSRCCV